MTKRRTYSLLHESDEPLLPSQWQRRSTPYTKESDLMYAVLMQAIDDWKTYIQSRGTHINCLHVRRAGSGRAPNPIPTLVEYTAELRAWFTSDETDYCFAFRTICDHFNLHPDGVRHAIFTWEPHTFAHVS